MLSAATAYPDKNKYISSMLFSYQDMKRTTLIYGYSARDVKDHCIRMLYVRVVIVLYSIRELKL